MFKKLLVASAVLAASTSVAFAGSYKGENYKGEAVAPCPSCQFLAGPYLGLSIGSRTNWQRRSDSHFHHFRGVRDFDADDPTVVVGGFGHGNRHDGGYNFFKGFSGIASIGYGMMVNPMFYVAGEFFAGDTARLSNKHNNDIRSTWDYGFDVIPGVLVADCVLGYVRGGVIRTQFKGHDNRGRTGWRVGLGGETQIVQNWDARLEYIYNQYGKSSSGRDREHHGFVTTTSTTTGFGTGFRHHGHHGKGNNIRAEQFNLGVVYKFL
jgi:opacity protein-like surface antigen